MPEDLTWYESLEKNDGRRYLTEEMCSKVNNGGPSVVLNCMKTGKQFCVEYKNGEKTKFYKDCLYIDRTYRGEPGSIDVNCNAGRVTLLFENVIRSAYSPEELAAN